MKKKAREIAFLTLFQSEFTQPLTINHLLDLFESDLPAAAVADIETLVEGVRTSLTKIDERIQASSQNWNVSRLSSVDRTILRLAVYEMIFSPHRLDAALVINEAIELAKKYSSEEAPRFVNGVLDQAAKRGP